MPDTSSTSSEWAAMSDFIVNDADADDDASAHEQTTDSDDGSGGGGGGRYTKLRCAHKDDDEEVVDLRHNGMRSPAERARRQRMREQRDQRTARGSMSDSEASSSSESVSRTLSSSESGNVGTDPSVAMIREFCSGADCTSLVRRLADMLRTTTRFGAESNWPRSTLLRAAADGHALDVRTTEHVERAVCFACAARKECAYELVNEARQVIGRVGRVCAARFRALCAVVDALQCAARMLGTDDDDDDAADIDELSAAFWRADDEWRALMDAEKWT